MELRKDPITQSWVIQEETNGDWLEEEGCLLCPGQEDLCPRAVYEHPYGQRDWQVRVIPHLHPLYRIEGDVHRQGEGIYDKMRSLGAHEIVIEHPDHHLPLSRQSDEHVAQVLRAYAWRVTELKKDPRFRYVTVFRNQGSRAGQDIEHPHSQITATPFIPRRVIYELHSAERHFALKERCLFCDIVQQELRQRVRTVECDEMFAAFCPFASRVPYETWIIPIAHHCSFEEDLESWEPQLHLARFLKSVLRRLETVTPEYHLILHTSPNVKAKLGRKGQWRTLSEDFHWHFEIVPVFQLKAKSHGVKEVYHNSVLPEFSARELRRARVETEVES